MWINENKMLDRYIKDELKVFHQSDLRPWFEIEKALKKYMIENNIASLTKEEHVELSKKRWKKQKFTQDQ